MRNDLTELVCVIDRSGSMGSIRTDAIGGFNTFLEEQKKVPGKAIMTIVLFNQEYDLLCDGVDLETVKNLTCETYIPGGMTALLDAVGNTIQTIGMRLHEMPEPERPGKVIFAILTDGLENASKEYSYQQVSSMIKHQQDKYGWEFIYLAANQDAISEAKKISIQAPNAMNFQASSSGIRNAFQQVSYNLRTRRMSIIDFNEQKESQVHSKECPNKDISGRQEPNRR